MKPIKRKLKKKSKTDPAKRPERIIRKYKKQRCDFVTIDVDTKEVSQCKNNAVGKGTLCKKHGGDPIIKENLIPIQHENELISVGTKFNPAIHPLQYIELSREGMSKVEIAAAMEVSITALQGWAEKFESFNTASEIGDALHETWWIQQGKGGLESRHFNTSLFKYLTMNKLGYSDKIEQKNLNMNVHGVLAVPDKVSAEEWEAEIIDI